jgi:hypothetical protein
VGDTNVPETVEDSPYLPEDCCCELENGDCERWPETCDSDCYYCRDQGIWHMCCHGGDDVEDGECDFCDEEEE